MNDNGNDEGKFRETVIYMKSPYCNSQKFNLPTFPKGGGGGGIERFLCLCECLINISEKGLVGVGDLERDGVFPAFSVK